MNDREWLEELKEKYLNATVIESINDVDVIAVDKKDVEWFIKQAERVQELERDYKFGAEQMKNVVNMHNEKDIELRKTQMQNKRYREALEQIASSRITIADGFGNVRTEKNTNSKRHIDSLIAEKVMGWTRKELPTNKVNPSYTAWYWVNDDDSVKIPTNFFNPSINLNDAWKALGKFDGHILTKSDDCICEILLHDGKGYDIIGESREETAELAICLAALKAVGVEVDD